MTADELYREFLLAAGQQTAGQQTAGFGLAELIAQIGAVPPGATPAAPAAPATASRSTAQSSQGGGDSTLVTVLKNGLGIAPLVGGLISLFGGGGGSDTPPPLVKYALPAAVNFDAAETAGGGFAAASYDQGGSARGFAPTGPAGGTTAAPTAPATPQITVNVSAMDARSFLDRSTDIAAAVREAMLNLNSINDVVNDL
jgi:hypothetical protein